MPRRLGAAVFLFLLTQAAQGQLNDIDQLFRQTGLQQQIYEIPGAMDEMSAPIIRKTCPRCSAQTVASISAALRDAFEPAALYQEIRQRFAQRYNSTYALLVFHDLEATVYGRINALDLQAETPTVKKYVAQVMATPGAPPPGKRTQLLRQFAQASGTSDVMVSLVCQIVRSLAPAPAGCGEITAPIKSAYTDAMVKRWNYLYQSLSDQDLTEAIRIAGTPAERWYMTAVTQATGDAFAVRMQFAMARLAREIQPAR